MLLWSAQNNRALRFMPNKPSVSTTDLSLDREFPPNPHYGSGCFRRHIRLRNESWGVLAELEDDCHGFRVRLHHNGLQVTSIEAETLRIPYDTCPGATEPLRSLEGIAIGSEPRSIFEKANPFSNCTHLFDLSVLAISHAARAEIERFYEIRVDDEQNSAPATATIRRNGEEILRWTTYQWQLVTPLEVAAYPLFKGFAAWANDFYEGEEREAAFALQKGYFVSSARRYDAARMAGSRGDELPYQPGACHTYTPGTVEKATRLHNTVRDFTDTPAELLRFK